MKLTNDQQSLVRLAMNAEIASWKKLLIPGDKWPYAEKKIAELQAIADLFYRGDIEVSTK